MDISPAQCRAARGLLDHSQQKLAAHSRVGIATVRQFEGGFGQPRAATVQAILLALEFAGVEFTNGGQPGLRMKAVG